VHPMKVSELRKKRAERAAEARRIVELAISENRDNSPEERASIDRIMADLVEYDRRIAVLERVEDVESDSETRSGRRTSPPGTDPLEDTDHEYSLLRAYRCIIGLERGGLEAEVSQEISVRSGRKPQGLYVPWNLHSRSQRKIAMERRSLNTGSGAGSVANVLGTELIELLRNKMVLTPLGARVMTDMEGGTFSLPKQTATTTAYWVAEGNTPSGSNLTINQVTWTPKTVGAFTDLTRKFMLQTNQSAEALARDDLTRMLAIEVDRVGINGSGQNNQPLGILQDSNVTVITLGTNGAIPTWAAVVNMEKSVAQANAEFGKLGYLSSNGGRAIMKQTPKVGSTFPVFLWEDDNNGEGRVNARRALASEQVPSNLTKGSSSGICTAILYGNWDSATYAFWGGVDVLVDPYTGSNAGTVRFVTLQDADFQLRYDQSFVKIVDALMQ
jgi:HK97 family phage major capsid protein